MNGGGGSSGAELRTQLTFIQSGHLTCSQDLLCCSEMGWLTTTSLLTGDLRHTVLGYILMSLSR